MSCSRCASSSGSVANSQTAQRYPQIVIFATLAAEADLAGRVSLGQHPEVESELLVASELCPRQGYSRSFQSAHTHRGSGEHRLCSQYSRAISDSEG